MGVEGGLALAGLVLVAGAVVWRVWWQRRRRDKIAGALLDSDPGVRAGALQAMAATGVRPWADFLLSRTATLDASRDDPAAHSRAAELAWLITACQWEPADRAAIVQLRIWANSFHGREAVPSRADPARPVTPAGVTAAAQSLVRLDTVVAEALGEPVLRAEFIPRLPAD